MLLVINPEDPNRERIISYCLQDGTNSFGPLQDARGPPYDTPEQYVILSNDYYVWVSNYGNIQENYRGKLVGLERLMQAVKNNYPSKALMEPEPDVENQFFVVLPATSGN